MLGRILFFIFGLLVGLGAFYYQKDDQPIRTPLNEIWLSDKAILSQVAIQNAYYDALTRVAGNLYLKNPDKFDKFKFYSTGPSFENFIPEIKPVKNYIESYNYAFKEAMTSGSNMNLVLKHDLHSVKNSL
jgi:hypothetical protein